MKECNFASGTAVNGDSFLNTFADGFSFASLFGLNEEDIMGELNSFEVALGEDADWEGVFALLDSSVFESGWNYSETSTGAVWERNDVIPEPSPTPEPATLVIFGAGLAGAGVAALRRRKK